MKLVGIDYGTKRVGVAVTDESGGMAFPRAIFPNDKTLFSELTAFIEKEGVEAVVVGESKNKDGEDNPVMRDIRAFSEELSRALNLPVHFEPEFYTTHEAKRLSEDVKPNKKGDYVDAQAAAIILNSYISRD